MIARVIFIPAFITLLSLILVAKESFLWLKSLISEHVLGANVQVDVLQRNLEQGLYLFY